MVMKKIALLHHGLSKFGVIDEMLQNLQTALQRHNIEAKLCLDLKSLYTYAIANEIDATWSINIALPEHFLYQSHGIPHICLFLDQASYVPSSCYQDSHLIPLFVDEDSISLFQQLSGKKSHLCPHAIAKETLDYVRCQEYVPSEKRLYDVVLIGSYIDHESEKNFWRERFSPKVVDHLLFIAESFLELDAYNLPAALLELCDKERLFQTMNGTFKELINSVERYVRGLDRERVIRALQGRKIDIWTTEEDAQLWSAHEYMNEVIFHKPFAFTDVVKLLLQAKVVIQSLPMIKKGYHERLLLALASGATVLTNAHTPFIKPFSSMASVVLYRNSTLPHLHKALDEGKKGLFDRKKILLYLEEEHTWDARLKIIIPQIDKQLEELGDRFRQNPGRSLLV
jgi:hypothetical protein